MPDYGGRSCGVVSLFSGSFRCEFRSPHSRFVGFAPGLVEIDEIVDVRARHLVLFTPNSTRCFLCFNEERLGRVVLSHLGIQGPEATDHDQCLEVLRAIDLASGLKCSEVQFERFVIATQLLVHQGKELADIGRFCPQLTLMAPADIQSLFT